MKVRAMCRACLPVAGGLAWQEVQVTEPSHVGAALVPPVNVPWQYVELQVPLAYVPPATIAAVKATLATPSACLTA